MIDARVNRRTFLGGSVALAATGFLGGTPPASARSWVLPNSPTGVPLLHGVIADAFEWLMFDPDRPGYDYLTEWDWNVEPFQMKKAEKIYDATDLNLLDVMLRGKKILMYHGWSDPAANAVRSIRYRESVVDFLADKLHLKRRLDFVAENLTDRFLKLYLVPGMAHCGGGVGHSTVDWFSPLVDWVEHHRAPKEIIGTRGTSTRPHCPYPQEALWTGAGSTDDAANFVCKRVHDR
jgi:feruloyl esterase